MLLLAWAKLSRDFLPSPCHVSDDITRQATKLVQKNTTTRIHLCEIRIEALSTPNGGTVMGGMGRRAFYGALSPY